MADNGVSAGLIESEIDFEGCGAARKLAICMRLSMLSYMRAPPEAEKISTGCFCLVLCSIMRVIFSPTTEPKEGC